MDMEYKYLIFVEGNSNHNKFHEMIHDRTFTVKYGRIGSKVNECVQIKSLFQKKLNEKLKKGYQDKTDFHKQSTSSAGSRT